MATQIYVNIPVKDLDRSIQFFTALGFMFNPQFTNKNATCMIISEDIFAMLLTEPFFKTFTKKEICDSSKNIEAIMALSVDNKSKVDDIVDNAIKAGGTSPKDTQNDGWMYSRSFEDPDGHLWEIFYMDESDMPPQP
ncbi:VOC family protein [Danxiaibacter flavus]|uniref:VOC family protein n=1 Tax=Danxiaibacter flavus TaxID=3049108 RepID=A0ABV3ZI75_9BACT|nr:VOC family protein [Chitinophagaceae bacterium DXS]